MQLGFVSAILPDLSLEQLLSFAREEGFACVELMCWPPGTADRRYAGVTHLDVTRMDSAGVARVTDLVKETGVRISGLGYYPNPLSPDAEHRRVVAAHLEKVIDAAKLLGVGVVNTFIGRDPARTIESQWPIFDEVWPALAQRAAQAGVKIAIENCPMLFSNDEWPGGKNLAIGPEAWRKMFARLPGDTMGLNLDPSHLIWQHIDPARCVREFGKRIYHVHAKDTRIDHDVLFDRGILGLGWHTPKLPGMGDVNWGAFFSALTDSGYNGPVCIEVEDRAYEGSLADRQRSLRQSKRFLEQWVTE
jgi:sugar phosphate isomerase/epimerase